MFSTAHLKSPYTDIFRSGNKRCIGKHSQVLIIHLYSTDYLRTGISGMEDDMMDRLRARRRLLPEEKAQKFKEQKKHEHIRNLQNEANETAFLLARNIGLEDERPRGLEVLEQKSEALLESARQFHLTASMVKFKQKYWVCRTKYMNSLRRQLGRMEKPIPSAPLYYSDVEDENATQPAAPVPTMENAAED
ncbi:hypothetical protein Ciccas_004563 [Cichlidogyrus casuarinus]|uniref:V-SNARE coiled-coil homology domain-containing protein n=1 Tax=Cichlidogyrus casuarinus TaxID=1844966 RepID=A0ABD2QB90_9PLAT